ncbi:MAG: tRNA 2-thiouridine(34) synthase MnmA [Gammaproteobacteria bacterium]|nr:tRNA 2-thiouridine(34) synthase MnmA [Gammaproteobacteria bacterium]
MKKIYAGMSGGVDSSLTAALLSEQGYEVTGVYMKNWTQDFPGFECPWKEDVADAQRVAVQLGIPFEVFDFEKDYKLRVVDYMVEEYKSGRTPNPDVMCNQEIKFKIFLDTAIENGADGIATGHYCRTENGQLLKGIDTNKDQSYFLYRVTEDALTKSLMPLGGMNKPDVREAAKKRGLITANKPDSQGICFVGEVGVRDFLSRYVETSPGPIVDQHGNEIGQHDGAIFYTIGQRQGLGVGGGLPYYVTHKDMDTNTVYVTTDVGDDKLWTEQFTMRDVHWINEAPEMTMSWEIRMRYRAKLVKCRLEQVKDGVRVMLDDPERAIAPGQSAVVYDGDRVVGGGIISDIT